MYTDIHTHILPGADDGATNMNVSLEMIEMEYNQGVRNIILTPHFGVYNPYFDKSKAEKDFRELKERCQGRFPHLNLYLGNEIYSSPMMVEALADEKASTLAQTDYVLMEFRYSEEFPAIEKAVESLVMAGYRPVIAHPERYKCLLGSTKKVSSLVYHGAYIQINCDSLLKGMMDKEYRFCRKLVKEDLVHFVATDAHNTTTRKPCIEMAVEKLMAITDEEQVRRITSINGQKLINNEEI